MKKILLVLAMSALISACSVGGSIGVGGGSNGVGVGLGLGAGFGF